MNSLKNRRLGALLGFVTLLGLAASACDVRPAINRVQPNALSKEMFDGEWYYQQTVVDSPFDSGFTFTGNQGTMERLRWDIQENTLFARRTYEWVSGSDPEGINGTTDIQGSVVAAYRIISHFDIRRDFNPVTGEEQNVIIEDSQNRPWYQRQYMRVDWSQNMAEASDIFYFSRLFDGLDVTSLSYFPTRGCDNSDPLENDANCPRFERASSSAPVNYMEVTTQLVARPTEVDLGDGFRIPSCFLNNYFYGDVQDCADVTVTVRNSFMRVDESRDYQPFNYTGDRMELAGYFVTERAEYDPEVGTVDDLRYRFANRHNLWQQSHRRAANGDVQSCASDDECDPSAGSRCDIDYGRAYRLYDTLCVENNGTPHVCSSATCEDAEGNPAVCETVTTVRQRRQIGACTIPYREREIRPIVYYASENTPESLMPDLRHLASEWNDAFASTIESLRINECVDPNGDGRGLTDRSECEDLNRLPEAQRAVSGFVLCHSPVRADDADACGPEGTLARIGDLRYNLIGYVNEPDRQSPLGYGPSSADPLTGEIVMGNAFVYGAGLERLATDATTMVRLLIGDITSDDVADGANIEDFVSRILTTGSVETGRPADDHAVPVDAFNLDQYAGAMDFSYLPRGNRNGQGFNGESRADFNRFRREAASRLLDRGVFGRGVNAGQARLDSLVGTPIERLLSNLPEAAIASGVDPRLPRSSGSALEQISPLRRGLLNPHNLRRLEDARNRLNARQCVMAADYTDVGMIGLAREILRSAQAGEPMEWYGEQYELATVREGGVVRLNTDLVRELLIHPMFQAVTSHEVGHTLGLRHNFTGSADAVNFDAEYWDLRDDGSMGPRLSDPMTDAEINGRITEYQTSTVMDYGNNFVVQVAQGIGHYDRFAIGLGYGDMVQVFANNGEAPVGNDLNPNGVVAQVAGRYLVRDYDLPVRLGLTPDGFAFQQPLSTYHYTEWPSVVGGRANLQARFSVPYTGSIIHVEGNTLYPVVPFLFGSDENADISVFNNTRYDIGADVYEATQSVIDSYWFGYVFSHFRRDRVGFSPDSAISRSANRYFGKLQGTNQTYTLWRGIAEELTNGAPVPDSFWTQGTAAAFTAAAAATYSMFTRIVAAPEPGLFGSVTRPDGSAMLESTGEICGNNLDDDQDQAIDESGNSPFGTCGLTNNRVDVFEGRFIETSWDNDDQGYFWFRNVDRVGYTYDKLYALIFLADPTTYFINRDTAADVREYQISYMNAFGPSLTSFYRGVLGEDWNTVGGRFAANGDVLFPTPVDLQNGTMQAPGTPIDPSISFSVQLIGTIYGTALLPQTYNQDYLNRARIFANGADESLDIPANRIVEFVDTSSGITYSAVSYVEGGRETGIGARMLQYATALQTEGRTAELRQYIDNIDLQRRMTAIFGQGVQPLGL